MANIVLYDENKNGYTGADAINKLYNNLPDNPNNIASLLNFLIADVNSITQVCSDMIDVFSSFPTTWSESLSKTFYDKFSTLDINFNSISNRLFSYMAELDRYY